MKKQYGEIMEYLLRSQGRYPRPEEFRAFLRESARSLARDLKEFEIELALVPDTKVTGTAKRDRNELKIGCE